jgi:group I intron endonuclease
VAKLSGVYRITIGRRYYYGSSKDLAKRQRGHVAELQLQRHGNRIMQRAWDKYQQCNFEIVELCHIDDLVTREQFYLDQSIGDPLNMNISSKSTPGFHAKHTDEAKRKIAQARKGRKHTDEAKRKIAQAHKERKRSPHSDETKRKIAQTLTGETLSAQHKESISRGLRAYHARNRS